MSLDLDTVEREARNHLERCRAAEVRMSECKPHPGIVPELCETILQLTAELRKAQKARGR